MTRVGLVTTEVDFLRDHDVDRPLLLDALGRLGVTADDPVWSDDSVEWSAYDLIVMQSPWDYSARAAEFMAWLETVSSVTEVQNPPEVIRWNLDKRYMTDLADIGLPVVPSSFATSVDEAAANIKRFEVDAVVVKPHVSAGSQDTGLFSSHDPGALELAAEIIAAGKVVLIQPAIPSVQRVGETAAIFFDGVLSHAVAKGPLLAHGGGLRGGTYIENIAPAALTATQADVAQQAMEAAVTIAATRLGGRQSSALLYGRVDLVAAEGGQPLVLELELFEPAFFAEFGEDAADRFAAAIGDRLG